MTWREGIVVPLLQMRKLRIREVKRLVQDSSSQTALGCAQSLALWGADKQGQTAALGGQLEIMMGTNAEPLLCAGPAPGIRLPLARPRPAQPPRAHLTGSPLSRLPPSS